MLRFEDILDKIQQYQPDADLDFLRRAYIYSAKVHQGASRLSGEPYLVHPIEVAGILADRTGNFRLGFMILAILSGIGSVFFMIARRPADRGPATDAMPEASAATMS